MGLQKKNADAEIDDFHIASISVIFTSSTSTSTLMYILFLYFRSSTIFIANVDAKTTPMDLWIASVPQGWSSLKTVARNICILYINYYF